MELLPLDSPIPCNKPIAVFIKSIKQHETEEGNQGLSTDGIAQYCHQVRNTDTQL